MPAKKNNDLQLRSIAYRPMSEEKKDLFPFNLPIIDQLPEIVFDSPVTFFVGENGSGKSTLLEGLAVASNAITVGSENVRHDKSLSAIQQFAWQLAFACKKRTNRGFFLRAEDFFGYTKRIRQTREELERDLKAVDTDYVGRSQFAINQARTPYLGQLAALESKYGDGLETKSHGESFLHLFQQRFVPDGLYLVDEPEAPLSPLRQLTFISMVREMVAQGGQFIIATHSPIILAFPGAAIYSFDTIPLERTTYEDLEHVSLTRDFLANPEAYLKHL